MTLKIRHTLFLLFTIAFFVITPLTILSAAGYKIRLSWPPNLKQTWQKTGIFVLDSSPRNAKIFIDDKPRQLFLKKYFNQEESYIKTAAKIKNIIPGEYKVRLELPGYWPWEKKLTIEPGKSTYAEDIYLFKKNVPLQIIDLAPAEKNFSQLPTRRIIQSPNQKNFFVLNEEKIIISLAEDNDSMAIPLSSLKRQIKPESPIAWSENNERILAGRIIFNLKEPDKIIYLDEWTESKADNFSWDRNNPGKIYYRSGNSINSFDLNAKAKKPIISGEQYFDYLIKNNSLFFISQTSKTTKLKESSLKNGNIIKEIELPYSSQYKFINSEHNLVNVYDGKHEILYLIDPSLPINPLREIINNIKYSYWINNNQLLYANDFEIWLFDMNNNRQTSETGKKILTRISQPIGSIRWHPNNNHVIFSTDKTINVIELDEREKRNIIELIKLDEIYSLALSQKGDILYFGAKIGNQEGLYKMEMQ